MKKLIFKAENGKIVAKLGRKIVAFINNRADGQIYFAFGKPSQSCYIAINANSYEDAMNVIEENIKCMVA